MFGLFMILIARYHTWENFNKYHRSFDTKYQLDIQYQ